MITFILIMLVLIFVVLPLITLFCYGFIFFCSLSVMTKAMQDDKEKSKASDKAKMKREIIADEKEKSNREKEIIRRDYDKRLKAVEKTFNKGSK